MELLPVLQALSAQHDYIELLRDHPKIPASQLQKCEAILSNIEYALEEVVTSPLPRSASDIKHCITNVLRSIGMMEKTIAAHESAEHDYGGTLADTLRLRIAEAGLLALRFHLRILTDALPTADDDTHDWAN
jgi:hypothetical protein